MCLVYIYVALASYNTGYLTLPLISIETVVDEAANIAGVDGKGTMKRSYTKGSGKGRVMKETRETKAARQKSAAEKRDWRSLWSEGTDAVMDVPLGGVCEVLYGEGGDPNKEAEEEDT
jgi:phosphatidylinositol glycan class P protein